MHQLSCSIVLFNTDENDLTHAVQSVLQSNLSIELYLVDNSPTNKLKTIAEKFNVNYIFNNKNLGFGAAHNIAIKNALNYSQYHLVLNPDVEFKKGVLENIYAFMEAHQDIGQLLPKVLYNNGALQKLCNPLPKPVNLIGRRFFQNIRWSKKLNEEYELKGFNYDRCLNVPNLSGCFMFLRCSILKKTGLFDERYFMYMEDIDLCRRVHAVSKTVFYPDVSILHGFEKESYSNKAVLKYHIQSAIKYFTKWGWFFDEERKKFNQQLLRQIKENNNSVQTFFKPRLLILTNRIVVGGISNDIIPLSYYLRSDFDILILHGEKDEGEKDACFLLDRYPGLKIKKIPSFKKQINPINDITAWLFILKEIRDFNADIVHTHGAKSGFMGRLAAHRSNVPCILHTYHGHHFHSYYNRFASSFLLKMERRLGRITSIIIAISAFQKKELTEIYNIVPPQKIKIISLGIEAEKINIVKERSLFRAKYNIDEDVIAISIAGRIVPVKNLKLFIQVAEKLLSSVSKKICFFIMGDGILKKHIKAQCASADITYTEIAGAKADVIFTSWIEDIVPAMHAMDIIALTSNNEGTPMSLIEAQFCGKPVVATNAGGVKDTILVNETGFLAEPGDADTLFQKLKLLIENDALRKTMGSKAASFAAENFSKQKEVENYKQLYKTLLTPKKTGRSVLQQTVTE